MQKKKAILFDYDGVLADTVNDNFQALYHAFKTHNKKIKKSDYMSLEGMSLFGIVENIGAKYGVKKIFFPEIVKEKEMFYKKHNRFRLYEGIEKLVMMLKDKNMKLAVVSGASKERLFSATNTSFLQLFDAIITGETVKNYKPHPDPYITALRLLDVTSQEAIVVENAPLGIESAKSAQIFCIAFTSTLEKSYLARADMVVDTVKKLHNNLEKIIGGGELI